MGDQEGVDITNLVLACVSAFVCIFILMLGTRVACWILEYLNRDYEAFLEYMGFLGVGTTALQAYKNVAPNTYMDTGDAKFGKRLISAVGGSLPEHGMGLDNNRPFVDTAPVGALSALYTTLKKSRVTIRDLKAENLILVRRTE